MDSCNICKVEECYCGWKAHVEQLWDRGWDMENEEKRWRRSWERWMSSPQQLLNAKIASMTPDNEDDDEGEVNYEDFDFAGKVFLLETNSLEVFEKLPSGEPGAKVEFKAQSATPPVNPSPPPTAPAAPGQPQ
jgi:hypothetical protein